MNSSFFRDMGFLKGLRDDADISYQRPLSMESTPIGHRWPESAA